MEEDEENYISFGTPLTDIEDETTIRKKAARELQVRDEKGRQRFHGAFTGGFSAGYFNTVGTKEGWAPSSFISSRNKVAERVQQNPEDYMDDEDFGEFGIATKKIHTTSSFLDTSDSINKKRKNFSNDSVIPGEAPLKDIVKPVYESVGIQILRKLGWRPGQGIGPRIKKQVADKKVYGCSPYPDAVENVEEDPNFLLYTFAPEDTTSIFYQPKDNYFGLGYSGLPKESVLKAHVDLFAPTTTKSFFAKDKKKLTISGQAFGVGAFEDDDDDIYAKDDMSQYDFSEFALQEDKGIAKNDDPKKLGRSAATLPGFCPASHPPLVKKCYPPPVLPPDFRPRHSVISSKNEVQNKSRHALSSDERSSILGEKKFQLPPTSGDVMPQKKSFNVQDSPAVVTLPNRNVPSFKPFPNDSTKQQRYEEYLKLKNSGEVEKLKQPSSMTEWEKQQEIEEFARAAILFRPLSTALSSRFESRSHLSVEHEVMDALQKIKEDKNEKPSTRRKLVGLSNRKTLEWHPSALLCKRFNVPNPYPNSNFDGVIDDKKKSLFGHLSAPDVTKEPSDLKPENTSRIEMQTNVITKSEEHQRVHPIPSDKVTDEKAETPVILNERPPIDFFKDIFENTSEEEGEETEDLKSPGKSVTTTKDSDEADSDDVPSQTHLNSSSSAVLGTAAKESPRSSEIANSVCDIRTTPPAKRSGFGVFANIDLDALNKRTKTCDKSSLKTGTFENVDANAADRQRNAGETNSSEVEMKDSSNNDAQNQPSEDCYGPELPPDYSVDSSVSVPKLYPKKHSKHKHKHHKHKSNKKKKKKSSKRVETSDSSDEMDDIPPELILEKLKKIKKGTLL